MHPYLFKWGAITIWSYGLMLDLGFLAGAIVAAREADRKGIGGEWMYDLLLVILVVGVIMSRALYVLLNLGLYVSNPWTILNITEGGLALHGALLGGLLVAIWFCRRKKVAFYDLADTVSPSLALGISIARWGCFLNGCCYGLPTNAAWGALTRYVPGLRHPSQIYESILAAGLFAFLWWVRTRTRARGQLFMLFLMMYSVVRFFVEFFRESSYLGPLTQAQVASLAIALVALWWFFRLEQGAEKAKPTADSQACPQEDAQSPCAAPGETPACCAAGEDAAAETAEAVQPGAGSPESGQEDTPEAGQYGDDPLKQ